MAGIDAYTKLMLHLDGTDGSTTITDSSLSPKTMTANGNMQIDTAQSVFGGASGLFDGTGDYISTPDSSDFTLGSGDFTMDMRVRFNSRGAFSTIASQWDAVPGQYNFILTVANTNTLYFFYSTDGTAFSSVSVTWNPSTATWYHLAVVRTGNVMKFFVDGTQVGTDQAFNLTMFDSSADFIVGANQTNYFDGWIDEFRHSVGVARWTSDFTPPTSAYSEDTTFVPRIIMM